MMMTSSMYPRTNCQRYSTNSLSIRYQKNPRVFARPIVKTLSHSQPRWGLTKVVFHQSEGRVPCQKNPLVRSTDKKTIDPPTAPRIVSYLDRGQASGQSLVLTFLKSTTTRGLPFFQTTKAGEEAAEGTPKGTFSIRPYSTNGSRIKSIALRSRWDRLNGFCFSPDRSDLSLKGIGMSIPSLNLPRPGRKRLQYFSRTFSMRSRYSGPQCSEMSACGTATSSGKSTIQGRSGSSLNLPIKTSAKQKSI